MNKTDLGEKKPGKPGPKRAAYHHGDLRAHLIETVRTLVEEKGADGFSISEAARRAGVSSAAPYKHFADKDAIVREVAMEGMRRLGAQMDAQAQAADPHNFGRVNAIGHVYVDFARREPGVFRLMFGLTEGHDGDPEMEEVGRATYGIVIREVISAMPQGTPEEVIRRRAYMLWMCVHGHSFLQIDRKVNVSEITAPDAEVLAELSVRILGEPS
ncbi:MAG: TetR/AcrR family transcriptional regulator [Devosiaceae bacterium]|nr:TetR/AcrR family transcriptional regulator [Devosiaceae bacterium MH13]